MTLWPGCSERARPEERAPDLGGSLLLPGCPPSSRILPPSSRLCFIPCRSAIDPDEGIQLRTRRPALACCGPRSHARGMFVVFEAEVAAIRTASEQHGELAARG